MSEMLGKVIIIVGRRGSGKTTIGKLLADQVHPDRLFVYDIHGDYPVNDYDRLPDIKQFQKDTEDVKGGMIIYEEASIFFGNRGNDPLMRRKLITSRQDRNVIVLMFHSIRAIPLYIYDLTDYVYICQTNDIEKNILKHEVLLPTWHEVQKLPPTKYPYIAYKSLKL